MKLKIWLAVILIFLSGCSKKEEPLPEVVEPEIIEEVIIEEEDDLEYFHSVYDELIINQQINPEVVAKLFFESGLINETVVQGSDNSRYLSLNWEDLSYRSYGSAFVDFFNDLNAFEQNTIIYGHFVYTFKDPSRSLMFTPLEKLREMENYPGNEYLYLVTNDEIRFYEIAIVYDAKLITDVHGNQFTTDELPYNHISYTEEEMGDYLSNAKAVEFYDTGVEVSSSDIFLTLQTCVEYHDELRQIVVCKEIRRVDIPEGWK